VSSAFLCASRDLVTVVTQYVYPSTLDWKQKMVTSRGTYWTDDKTRIRLLELSWFIYNNNHYDTVLCCIHSTHSVFPHHTILASSHSTKSYATTFPFFYGLTKPLASRGQHQHIDVVQVFAVPLMKQPHGSDGREAQHILNRWKEKILQQLMCSCSWVWIFLATLHQLSGVNVYDRVLGLWTR